MVVPFFWLKASNFASGFSLESRHRCFFYMCQLLTEHEEAQGTGAVLLIQMNPDGTSCGIDMDYLEMVIHALPLRFKAIHLLALGFSLNDSTKRRISTLCDEAHFHTSRSRLSLAKRLEEYGLIRAYLPTFLHGEWGHSKFTMWRDLRTRFEWSIPLGLISRDASFYSFPALYDEFEVLPDNQRRSTRAE